MAILLIVLGGIPVLAALVWMWRNDRDLLRAGLVAVISLCSIACLLVGISMLMAAS